jgi:tRNA nucleotidyltransferase/poly(A) polymerase
MSTLSREQIAEELHKLYLAKAHELGWAVRHECDVPYDRLTEAGKELDRMFADWHLQQVDALLRQREEEIDKLNGELHDKDVVPRSRYDACNKDWLEAEQKVREVGGAAIKEIELLCAQLAAMTAERDEVVRLSRYAVHEALLHSGHTVVEHTGNVFGQWQQAIQDALKAEQQLATARRALVEVRTEMDQLKEQVIEVVRTERQAGQAQAKKRR